MEGLGSWAQAVVGAPRDELQGARQLASEVVLAVALDRSSSARPPPRCSSPLLAAAAAMSQDGRFVAHVHAPPELLDVVDEDWRHETLAHDDFDLPHEDDSDTDEARSAPKRKVEEKWTELCLDDFTNPNGGRRGQPPRA